MLSALAQYVDIGVLKNSHLFFNILKMVQTLAVLTLTRILAATPVHQRQSCLDSHDELLLTLFFR